MPLACWKGIKYRGLNQSPTMLKAFDGRGLRPRVLLQYLVVQLRGETVSVDVEVVNTALDYNLLLGRRWFYDMTIVASLVFQCIKFTHQGKLVTIYQLE